MCTSPRMNEGCVDSKGRERNTWLVDVEKRYEQRRGEGEARVFKLPYNALLDPIQLSADLAPKSSSFVVLTGYSF